MNKSNNNKYLSELLKMTVKSKDEYFVRNLSLSEQVIEKPCRCDDGYADEDREPQVTSQTQIRIRQRKKCELVL